MTIIDIIPIWNILSKIIESAHGQSVDASVTAIVAQAWWSVVVAQTVLLPAFQKVALWLQQLATHTQNTWDDSIAKVLVQGAVWGLGLGTKLLMLFTAMGSADPRIRQRFEEIKKTA